MDISVQYFQPETQDDDDAVPTGRDETDSIRARAYYRRGDIIHVDHLHADACVAPRGRTLHVTGAPERGVDLDDSLAILRDRLTAPVTQGTGQATETIRRRRWRFRVPELNAAQRSDVKNNGFITITWNYFKNRCAIKTIVDPDDQSQDDLTTRLQDSDI